LRVRFVPPSSPSHQAIRMVGSHTAASAFHVLENRFRGFHDFLPHAVSRPRPVPLPRPQFEDPTYGVLTLGPSDLRTLYDSAALINKGTDGTGINIAIIGQTWVVPSDVAAFRQQFGITAHETDINVPGTGDSHTVSGDVGEAELDLEWSSASAPGANIIFVYSGSDYPNFNVSDSVVYVVEQGTNLAPGVGNGGAQVMSESYGGCDYFTTSVDADVEGEIAAAANLEGITYVASSGDTGSQSCLDFGVPGLFTGPPADMPGVTAVGGTEFCSGPPPAGYYPTCIFSANPPNAQITPYFNLSTFSAVEYPQPAGQPSLESIWNDSLVIPGYGDYTSAGGGAPSVLFPKPFYQVGPTPNDGARDVPDVSLTASPNNLGYEIYEQGEEADGGAGFGIIGGTSASAPSFAGILALLNQSVVARGGQPGLGDINPTLYALQASSATKNAFHDIVTGNNNIPCNPGGDAGPADPGCPSNGDYGGFSAGVGYDLASGLGTIDAQKLVAAWSFIPTHTSVSVPSTATVGTPVTISATVASTATSPLISGTVSFSFVTFNGGAGPVYGGDAGVTDESWLLGTVDLIPSTSIPERGTAQITASIPPGLTGQAYVVAMYNGDTSFLASHSSLATVTVGGSSLKVSPTSITVRPFGSATITTSGGAPPVTWSTEGTDNTCTLDGGYSCSGIESTSPTQAYFVAGGGYGSVTIVAIDTNGEEATVTVTTEGAPVDGGGNFPIVDDAGPPGGPGNPPLPGPDAGPVDAGPVDAGTTTTDAGSAVDSGSGSDDSGAPTDASTGTDSGNGSGSDSGPITGEDSGSGGGVDSSVPVEDSGVPTGSGEDAATPTSTPEAGADGGSGGGSSSSGCSCSTAGRGEQSTQAGMIGGVLFGLVAVGRRRRRNRR